MNYKITPINRGIKSSVISVKCLATKSGPTWLRIKSKLISLKCLALNYKLILISLAVFCLCCSCVTHQQIRKNPLPTAGSKKKWEQTQHFFLWGLVPHAKIKAYQVCGTNSTWQSVTINRSFGHIMLSIVTLGLYVPVNITLVCAHTTAPVSGEGHMVNPVLPKSHDRRTGPQTVTRFAGRRVGGDKGCLPFLPKSHDQRTGPQTVTRFAGRRLGGNDI